jgi:DNA-binding IclR family transcriptional regulator
VTTAPDTATSTFRSTGIGVLDRVMAILDTTEQEPMTSADIARKLALSQPTVYRLTSAMISHGLLSRDSRGRNHPGPRLSSAALAIAAGPILEDLRRDTGETAQVWVVRGQHRYCVASIDSTNELRASVPTGARFPIAKGGSAALALTAVPPDPSHPERRWVETLGHRTPGLCSVSVAVTVNGAVVAALCLTAPLARIGPDGPGARYGDLVTVAADRLAALLVAQLD